MRRIDADALLAEAMEEGAYGYVDAKQIADAPTIDAVSVKHSDVPDTNVGDLISRQAAIDAICKACSMEEDYHKCDGYPETSTWCDYLVALRALPSVQPKWIPVTERLPENGRWVLVYGRNWAIPIMAFHESDAWIDDQFEKHSVTHWMPLPEPPKGERKDYADNR